MYKITFTGWNRGLDKVKLTKLLRNDANLSLRDAKAIVDKILLGESVMLTVEHEQDALHLLAESRKIGAIATSPVIPGDGNANATSIRPACKTSSAPLQP